MTFLSSLRLSSLLSVSIQKRLRQSHGSVLRGDSGTSSLHVTPVRTQWASAVIFYWSYRSVTGDDAGMLQKQPSDQSPAVPVLLSHGVDSLGYHDRMKFNFT